MTPSHRRSRPGAYLYALGALLVVVAAGLVVMSQAADHRDGPIFGPPGITITNSRRDINDVYVFKSPANANNTVLIMDLSPFSTATTPNVFDPKVTFDIKVANRDLINTTDDMTFRVNFGDPDNLGVQDVTLRGLPAAKFPGTGGILAKGKTGQNIPVRGVGGANAMFRAAEQDDPFFFDATGFTAFLNGAAFPRPVGTAINFFGNDAGSGTNTLSIIVEVPTAVLQGPTNNLIGVWGRTELNGIQLDRMGRPAINTALIPPVPRGSNFPIGGTMAQNRQERRNAFNAGLPKDDRANFKSDMVSVLQNFYGHSAVDSSNIADLLLPDLVVFELGNANGFGGLIGSGTSFLGNGRRLRDDVIDFELTVLTNSAITTDNVFDDNGTGIKDGNMGTTAAFPYIGARNANSRGVPGGNPPP